MALSPTTRERIRNHWAERFDCRPAAFEESGVTVTGWPGRTVRVLRRGTATVVAVPERASDALAACRDAVADRPLTTVALALERALADHPVAVVDAAGPAVLSYVDVTAFSPVASEARLLTEEETGTVERLRARVPGGEWARASPTVRSGRTAGVFSDGRLVALATLAEPPFPDVGVVVDPEFRDSGLGRQVVSRVVEAALDRDAGVTPRYRTPESETASLALAASVGFERWASETVVVLD